MLDTILSLVIEITADDLEKAMIYTIKAHRDFPKLPENSVRKWDGKTPYSIHPIWCATTLLTETSLPEEVREAGYQALLYHDVLEDTTIGLPENTSLYVIQLVNEMIFENSDAEMREIWNRSKEVKLLKLYDKVSNLLDGIWIGIDKKKKYLEYVKKLTYEVEQSFGELNIVKMARTVTRDI